MLTAAQRESAMEALSRMMADSEGATSGLLDRLGVLEAQLAAKLRELDALQQQPHIPSGGGGIGTSSMCSSLGITSEGVLTESARTQDSLTPTPSRPPIYPPSHTPPLPTFHGSGVSSGGHRVAWERFVCPHATRDSPDETAAMERYGEALREVLPHHPHNPTQLLGLKSGWVDLLIDNFGVEIEIGNNPCSSLPSPSHLFCSNNGMDKFNTPGVQTLEDALHMYSKFFIRGDAWHDASREEIEVVETALLGSQKTLFVMVNREITSFWPSWLDLQVGKGFGTMIWAADSLNFRDYNPNHPKFTSLGGVWELFVVSNPIFGSPFNVKQNDKFHEAMFNMSRSVHGRNQKPNNTNNHNKKISNFEWHSLPLHDDASNDVPFTFQPKQVEDFWRQWDSICARREVLLKCSKVDWTEVQKTLEECNKLLLDSPDRHLRRIVRLAKLSPLMDLSIQDRFIYIIYGHYPPYIGQTGCISGPRSLMQRYKEHLRKSKTLVNYFSGIRYRRIRGLFQYGRLPSLAGVMAREGPSNFGIVPVQRVPDDQVGDILESKWIKVQGMVLNRQLPFHGMDRHYWSHLLSRDEPPSISAKHTVLDVLNGKAQALDAKAMLTISTRCVSHCDPPLFEKLFSMTKKKVKVEWCLILR